jgi:SAM-dependent methyltransferase
MKTSFLRQYFNAFDFIEGAFLFDAALMFMAYNSLLYENGISGDVLEIGVHHGRSAVAIASLRGSGREFFTIDLFEDLQAQNISSSGLGNKSAFLRNMSKFYENLDFLRLLTVNSGDLSAKELGTDFSFCHVDGGHSATETYADLALTHQLLKPGGLIALDDYFNPAFPGVCEGAIKFMLDHENGLTPIAIGFNKVLYQKNPSTFSLNGLFARKFSHIPKAHARMVDHPVYVFWDGFLPFFDLDRSVPSKLYSVVNDELSCRFEPAMSSIKAKPEEPVRLPVKVTNTSNRPFENGSSSFGLSFHLWSADGAMIKFDNKRSYFSSPINPGESAMMDLLIESPVEPGSYVVEIDIVWENVMWLQDKGNPTCSVDLLVG